MEATEMTPTANIPNAGLVTQIVISVMISTMGLNFGMYQGWNSLMGIKLKTDKSPVGILSTEDITNLASYPMYVSFFSCFIFSYVVKWYGRKIGTILVGCISLASGAVTTFSTDLIQLYIGRLMGGACAITTIQIGIMYVSEISHGSIRGMLTSICSVMMPFGNLTAYIFGKILDYQEFSSILIIIPLIYTLGVLWIPETPHFYLTQSRKEEAMKALVWLRGGNREAAKLEFMSMTPPSTEGKRTTFCEGFNNKAAKSALAITLLGFMLQTLSGIHSILNYGGVIFQISGSPLSEYDSIIVVAACFTCSVILSLILIDKIGRKLLLYMSFTGCAISLAALSIFFYFQMEGYDVTLVDWLPITSLIIFVISYGVGLSNVPSVLMNDISPVAVKPVISALSCGISILLSILVVQTYAFFEYHGLCYAFGIYSLANIAGLFYTRYLVIETKGISFTEISNELNGIFNEMIFPT